MLKLNDKYLNGFISAEELKAIQPEVVKADDTLMNRKAQEATSSVGSTFPLTMIKMNSTESSRLLKKSKSLVTFSL